MTPELRLYNLLANWLFDELFVSNTTYKAVKPLIKFVPDDMSPRDSSILFFTKTILFRPKFGFLTIMICQYAYLCCQ